MSSENKFWPKLPVPFRSSFDIVEASQPDAEARCTRRSGSQVSSVCLSEDSCAHGFAIVPESDEPDQTAPTVSGRTGSRFKSLPTGAFPSSSSHNDINNFSSELSPGIGNNHCRHSSEAIGKSGHVHTPIGVAGRPPDLNIIGAGQDHDREQRQGSANDDFRTIPSPVSPRVLLSSGPRVLRKKLGVPQHSVINHPVDCSPDPHNTHASHIPSSESECCERTVSPTRLTGPATLSHPHPIYPDVDTEPPTLSLSSSKKPSLHINTDVTTSHRPASVFTHLSLQNTPAITTGNVLVDNPTRYQVMSAGSRHSDVTTQSPTRVHTTHSWEPQSSQNKPSKLIKRRVGLHAVSPSAPPSLGHKVSRGMWPGKPAVGSGTSPSEQNRQESLPRLRTPSPFQVDIPIHHSWHDRRTTFHFSESRSENPAATPFPETTSRRTSVSTEALASLAWTGTPTPSLTSCPFIAALRHRQSSSDQSRHNGMTMDVDDDSVSDDVMVDRLERIRRMDRLTEQGRDSSPPRSSVTAHSSRLGGRRTSCTSPLHLWHSESNKVLSLPLIPDNHTSDSEDAATWQAARKTLLCIREIVRTERKYHDGMQMLLNSQTTAPPPPSMLTYVPALVRTSEMLLKGFLEDPSAWGVSTTFMACEDELEATMVSWCAVVGTFFTEGNNAEAGRLTGRRRLHKSGTMSGSQTVMSNPSSPVAKESTIKEGKRISDESWRTGENARGDSESQITLPALSSWKLVSGAGQEPNGQSPSRRFSVRDLAIQPTQRVMRYVLLYRDLLNCTPSASPSRPLVECALEVATRIANECDGAQRNPAFLRIQT
ncbi:hypothetical protein BU15DRAFT_58813 [Melanogaster broomeanus]|nr:hypothetical protein BU15DRAFT_58813 [Melanogaster broomeanus]